MDKNNKIVSAIIVAGVIIAGAILLRGSKPSTTEKAGIPVTTATLAPVDKTDMTLGNPQAKVTLIVYEDFQCPFCGAISGTNQEVIKYLKGRDATWEPFMPKVMDYVKDGKVFLVFRDFPFLGPESIRSSEAARCAFDQGKFWEYHDYLFSHQNGENKGNFSDQNLKNFAKELKLNSISFDKCLDDKKYEKLVTDIKASGEEAGVRGTPKGFILKDGKIAGTIDGAESFTTVKQKLDNALK